MLDLPQQMYQQYARECLFIKHETGNYDLNTRNLSKYIYTEKDNFLIGLQYIYQIRQVSPSYNKIFTIQTFLLPIIHYWGSAPVDRCSENKMK
jgi:hypothetical protein